MIIMGKLVLQGRLNLEKMSFCGRLGSTIANHIFITSTFVPSDLSRIRFVSNEIPNLQLEGFYVDEVRQRDSIRYIDVGTDNINHRFNKAATTDSFYTLGGSYQLKDYRLRAYHAELKDIYQQQFLGFNGKQPLNDQLNFLSDVRFLIVKKLEVKNRRSR